VVEEQDDFHIESEVRCEGAHPLCITLSWHGLNPIKLAYDTTLVGQSTFNLLAQYASSPGNTAYCYVCRTHCFFPSGASTHLLHLSTEEWSG